MLQKIDWVTDESRNRSPWSERISVEDQNARFGIVSLVVHVNGRKHLARVMRRVRNIRAVTHIGRVRH